MLTKLQGWGCDVNDALARFMDDKDLYIMCMNLFIADGSFDALGEAIQAEDYVAAFEAAHTLKGVAGNVSAGPLYDSIEKITASLRSQDYSTINEQYAKVMDLKNSLAAVLLS